MMVRDRALAARLGAAQMVYRRLWIRARAAELGLDAGRLRTLEHMDQVEAELRFRDRSRQVFQGRPLA